MYFEGVIPALVTPFGEDDAVDAGALARHAEWLLDNGATGLVGTGTMGEAQSLSAAERRLVIETLVEAADGRGDGDGRGVERDALRSARLRRRGRPPPAPAR